MEQIVKQTREVGTSAGVLLPRSWLNKKVVVSLAEKDNDIISKEVIEFLIKEGLLSEVKGIYLIGSYARGENEEGSDIDVLIITNSVNKLIHNFEYEIVLISEERFAKNLQNNLYSLISVREAIAIMNDTLIEKYKLIKPKINIKEFKREIVSILKINKEVIIENEKVSDKTIYSLVLRLRELYFLNCLLYNRKISKRDFENFIGIKAFQIYKKIKNNGDDKFELSYKESINLINLIEKWLKGLKE